MDERQGDVLEEWKQKRRGGKKVEHTSGGKISVEWGREKRTNERIKKKKTGELHVINVNLTILQFPRLMEHRKR